MFYSFFYFRGIFNERMKLQMSECTSCDIDRLISISRKTFIDAFEANNNPDDFKTYMQDSFSKEQLLKELADPQMTFYFVYSDNEIVGYFKLNENEAQSDIKDKNAIELERIYVKSEFQGKKIGYSMLNQVKHIAINKNMCYLWLGVWEKNTNAIRFYERNGFVKFGRHPYYIGRDRQMDWLMRLDLTNLKK